jgi:hypothetical protein
MQKQKRNREKSSTQAWEQGWQRHWHKAGESIFDALLHHAGSGPALPAMGKKPVL